MNRIARVAALVGVGLFFALAPTASAQIQFCTTAADCDDHNPCTVDSCVNIQSGQKVCRHQSAPAGTACNDGNACTTNDTCNGAGQCSPGTPTVCTALDQCHDPGTCNPSTGQCSNPAKANGTACNDGNACTQTDTCQAGTCTGGNPVVCTAVDQCHSPGTCNPSNGLCSNPAKPDGSACNDGNACTQTDVCVAGTCTGTNAVVCAASDQCHSPGTCDPSSGACSNPAKADGSACNDGNACTQTDTCQGGSCVGGNPVVCSAPDQCHTPGTCDPSSGACSNPAKADGTACNDGNACTQGDTCQGGACAGGTPVVCTASDQCHSPGTCDPSSGTCSNPVKPDGSACSDGDVCTTNDTCQGGTCLGGGALDCNDGNPCTNDFCTPGQGCGHSDVAAGVGCSDLNACNGSETCDGQGNCVAGQPVVCPPPDECHQAGTCNPADGTCSFAPKADGTACGSDGNDCTLDQCSNGTCSHPAVADGTACDDGNSCTPTDSCQMGTCVGTGTLDCDDHNACTSDFCTPASGCGHSNLPSGTSCGDTNLCNGNETCDGAGTCVSGSPVICPAPDECHDQGTCDTSTGQCSNPAKADNTPCSSDGNECTNDLCLSGTCSHPALPSGTACTDDGNVCTNDQCDGAGTCQHTPNTAPCDDGLFCNGTDVCAGGTCGHSGDPCAGGAECNNVCNETAKNCALPAGGACTDDGNVCTNDQCDGQGACAHTPNTAPCDDGIFCNGTDVCAGGTCGHSGDPCAGGAECNNVCNETAKNCAAPTGGACADDGNVCTDDKCNGAGACQHTPNTASCDNGVFCDGTDVCANGTCGHSGDPCAGGAECNNVCNETAKNCAVPAGGACADDGNVCTDDRCDGQGACGHTPNTASCDNGVFCDGTDTCSNGVCVSSGNPCAGGPECNNTCNETARNCLSPDGTQCTPDTDVCTADICQAGACTHPPAAANQDAAGTSRAFGVSLNVPALNGLQPVIDALIHPNPGPLLVDPTPDTDVPAGAPSPFLTVPASPVALINVLTVHAHHASTATGATADATATTADTHLLQSGADFLVNADTIQAKVTCSADANTAGCTSAGSVLQNVIIGGNKIGDVTEPKTFILNDPILKTTTTIKLLEMIPSGANAGVPQPQPGLGGTNSADLTVNAIHVTVSPNTGPLLPVGAPIADLIVAHAEAAVSSGPVCQNAPQVSGHAFVVGINGDENVIDPNNQLVSDEIARVDLPSTGSPGVDATLLQVGPLSSSGSTLVASGTASSHTDGTVSSGGNSGMSNSRAEVESLILLDNGTSPTNPLVGADVAKAECHAEAGPGGLSSTGTTTLLRPVIAGQPPICIPVIPSETCSPDPNTPISLAPTGILIIFNEQTCDNGGTLASNCSDGTNANATGITINAIHIFIVGQTNPLHLPVGVDIIISQAHCDAVRVPSAG